MPIKMVNEIIKPEEKEKIARIILTKLPDWFGLPESTEEYLRCCKNMPFWTATVDTKVQGFIALKENSAFTAEIYVMGVLPDLHHHGIGTLLFERFFNYAKEKGYEFIQVKTVQKGHYEEYDRTNQFYESLGFRELECLPTLWDKHNPCQIYIKAVI